MPTPYVLSPEWEWLLAIEMFIGGIAAGTMLFIVLVDLSGRTAADRDLAARLGFIPMPLMGIVAVLLIADLGQPSRFANLLLRSPFAPERGPSPFMFNTNSPMTWGSWIILLFGITTAIAFGDALTHTRRLRLPLVEALMHDRVFLAIAGLLAFATGAYSGVLINVTNQGVWSETFMLGALYTAFSALSGMAVAALLVDRWSTRGTAAAVRSGLTSYAAVTGVLMLIFLIWLAVAGHVAPLVATLHELVAPVFWIGVIAAVIAPLAIGAGYVRMPWRGAAALGAIVLAGVLALRLSILYSSIAFLQG